MYCLACPSAAARSSTSSAARTVACGSGPQVPALRYARSARTGNSARRAAASMAQRLLPGHVAKRAARVASVQMKVTLPDGSPLELPDGATGADAAAAIGPGL